MKGLVYCLVGLVVTGLCSATPTGREFITSFMYNLRSNGRDTNYLVEVAAPPSTQGKTKVKVTAAGGVSEKEIEPGKSFSFSLPDKIELKGSAKSRQAVLIEASQDVTVMALNYKKYTADTSVVYPVQDLGTEYMIFTPPGSKNDGYKEFSITNYKEQNTVEIVLQGSVRFEGKGYRKGSKLTIKLAPFETVQIQSQDNLSGSKVVSRLPVAVSSGHSCFQKYTGCNHVFEQLLPVNRWGKDFIIAPLNYHQPYGGFYDSVFVQASQPTKIKTNIDGKVKSYSMFAGQTLELHSKWPQAIHLTSDKGVQVLFEFNGGPEGTKNFYDPFLMTVLPTNQFSTSYALQGQSGFYNYFIVVAHNKDLGKIKVDPKPLTTAYKWIKVDGTDYSWAEIIYSIGADHHHISHPNSPIGVYSFGIAYANGYGSPASADGAEKSDCSTMKCAEDEVCQMRGDTPTCVKKPQGGTCWATGDPHYRTFDGKKYDFMGNCTYTMVKNCNVGGALPAFEVDAQNYRRGASKASYVGKVVIKVYGYTIAIARSEFGLVRMDNTLWNLPINLKNGKVKLYQSGMSVIVETDFGLAVKYDWKVSLFITVPDSLSGKVCGMCGNFNGKKDDDMMTPSGSKVSNAEAFGKSWRVPNVPEDAQCEDECHGQCEKCDENLSNSITENMVCGSLATIMDGPLSDCKAVIDHKVFHAMCLYDVCMGEGMNYVLCNTLEVYAEACQRAGIKIQNWRAMARCPLPKCPKNSHYEFCGSACHATCANPDAAKSCNKSCVETCVCDKGFVLSGTECVPKSQCGCLYNGHYVKAGASFFTDDKCAEKCTCNEATKKIECQKPGCKKGYECKVVDDIIGCHPLSYSECTMTSGPHYETFDGRDYGFLGTCVYQLAGVCSNDPSLQYFEVFVQNDAKKVGSSAKLVGLKIYGKTLIVPKSRKGFILLNGEQFNLPLKVKGDNITVYQVGESVEIKTDFGLLVSYDWISTVEVKIPSTYTNAMCGLCGNNNHNPKDDLLMKNGAQATTPEELGKSWRLAEIPGCVEGCKNQSHCPSCDITQKVKYESDRFCGLIKNPTGPFRECHAFINPDSFFKNCVYDVCLNDAKKGSYCGHLRRYTLACQRKGIKVYQWRSKDFCPICKMTHPDNSHYEQCGNVCHATCENGRPPTGCKRPCEETWVCNDGFLLSGGKCVPLAQCGCMDGDRYIKKGESFLTPDCKQNCTCDGTLTCVPHSCGPHANCALVNQVRACEPIKNSTCTIYGDPHYITFDKHHYDFQGTCTYTVAKSCHLDGTHLKEFSVVVENEEWNAPHLSAAKLVAVEVYGYTLILQRNQIGWIMVNDDLTAIPLDLNDGKIKVFQEGFHYAVVTDFGLKVTYDLVYKVTVTVPGTYMDKTCGLCGNFNNDKTDPFELPDGQKTTDVQTFGAAWKVAIPEVVCEDGCKGNLCPKCDSEMKEIFEKDCGIIKNPNGPFAVCHAVISPEYYFRDCVYDVCMSQGQRNVLCESVKAYVSDCQAVGIKIENWRSPTFCPIKCPENSHYEICAGTCASPCPGLTDIINCPTTCAEGCACKDGFYFNGTGCVAEQDCGCYYKGRTYKIGESVLSDSCQQRCTCTTSGEMECEDFSCGAMEKCEEKTGVQSCKPRQCRVENERSVTLFSGTTGKVSVMGAYEMITHCDESAADWFRVIVKLQECALSGEKSVVAIYFYFSDLAVSINDKQEIWVNGKKATLPSLPRKDVSVRLDDKTVVIEQAGHFKLLYSSSSEVVITVSNSMAGKLCGACEADHPDEDLTFTDEMMQEYMSSFPAQDFPTCELQ